MKAGVKSKSGAQLEGWKTVKGRLIPPEDSEDLITSPDTVPQPDSGRPFPATSLSTRFH